MIYVVGPGHGAPAVLACLWIEKALERYYPQYTRDLAGLKNLITGFSTPGGFPRYVCRRYGDHNLRLLTTIPVTSMLKRLAASTRVES
jgi:hypothetical protein